MIKPRNFIEALHPRFWVGAVMCRFFKQYRLVGETNEKGETHWKVQVRCNVMQWKNVVGERWKDYGFNYRAE
jgi:hypothetical protein